MTGQCAPKGRIFAVASVDARLSPRLASAAAAWVVTSGLAALVVNAARQNGDNPRRLSESAAHLRTLSPDIVKSYLALQKSSLCGALAMDIPLAEDILKNLANAYGIIFFALAPESLCFIPMLTPTVPTLVIVDALSENGIPEAIKFIDKMTDEKLSVRAAGFALDGAGNHAAARLSNRLKVPFWGFADDIGHISSRMLERAVALAGKNQPDDAGSGESDPSREIISILRKDDEFKNLALDAGETEELKKKVAKTAARIVGQMDPQKFAGQNEETIITRVVENSVGFGPIEKLIHDPAVTEIMVNGPFDVYFERGGITKKTSLSFADNDHLMAVVERMVALTGRRLDESSPMLDARLPDGSRLNVIIPPLAVGGAAVTIRKFVKRMNKMSELVHAGMLGEDVARFLSDCVRERISIVVSGGTGSGKTTFLNVLAAAIAETERIITIEDAAELSLAAKHVVRLESRPPGIEGTGAVTIRDLVRNALRMRPDRIVIGECRGPEALDMLQAMNTGHEGSMTTVHANSPRDAIARLETMVMTAGAELPLQAVREQIVRAVKLIVQLARQRDGKRRVIEMAELTGMEGPVPCLQTLAEFDVKAQTLVLTGLLPKFAERH